MKKIEALEANVEIKNIFSSAKSRSTFGLDFAKLDRESKCQYVKDYFGFEVFSHQKEALDVLTDPAGEDITINAARQTMKTMCFAWAQGLNAQHNLCPALDNITKVISLANKESQSLLVGSRLRTLLELNYDKTQFFWDREGSTKLHLVFKKESGVNTKLTGTVDYLTANPKAFQEGYTASVIFIDEAGRLDEKVFSEVILPYGGATNARIIIAGVSRGKGAFYDACNSKDYYHIHLPWDKASETYRRAAPVDLVDPITDKVILETGYYPLDIMPISLKKVYFPQNPWCHILPTTRQKEEWVYLWELSDGKISEEDFRSQYNLEWLAAVMAILQLEHQRLLFETGNFEPLPEGIGEQYFFGFDLGGAQNAYATGTNDKDTAALSIWRKREGVKEKVFCDELYSCQIDEAINWLLHYVHPQYGIYPCVRGGVDITGSIGAYASEKLIHSRLPVCPIMYNRMEETTKKNFKNAMFDYFKMELSAGRVRYPKEYFTDGLDPVTLKPQNPVWYKCRQQWEVVERKETGGINAVISAPSGEHDDHPNADVLAVFVMDRGDQFDAQLRAQKPRATVPRRGMSLLGGAPAMDSFRRATARNVVRY